MKELVLLIGLPGSGKDTQAELLEESLGYHVIKIGDEVRKQAQQNPELFNQEVNGRLADPKVVNNIVDKHLSISKSNAKIVCNGYPRSMQQAKALDEMIDKYDFDKVKVIFIKIGQDEILKRLKQRGREDDTEDAIKKRLEIFNNDTQEVLNYYLDKGELSTVDGMGTVEEVHNKIKNELL